MNLEQTVETLSLLPKLKILHLENDHLTKLPKNFSKIKNLESLYLNNNDFKKVPKEIINLKDLKYMDFQNNQIRDPLKINQIMNDYGVIITF